MKKDEKPKPVIYLGEQVGMDRKTVQVFRDKTGEEHIFSGIKSLWPGACYELLPGGKMKVRPTRIDADLELTDKDRINMEANKILVKAARLERQKALQIKKPAQEITRAINFLRPYYLSLSYFDRSRFMQYIANECSKKAKR